MRASVLAEHLGVVVLRHLHGGLHEAVGLGGAAQAHVLHVQDGERLVDWRRVGAQRLALQLGARGEDDLEQVLVAQRVVLQHALLRGDLPHVVHLEQPHALDVDGPELRYGRLTCLSTLW